VRLDEINGACDDDDHAAGEREGEVNENLRVSNFPYCMMNLDCG
jgi:hypothetical protein